MPKQRLNIADDGDPPVNTQAAALAERLRWLPVDGSDPTAVPAPLAQVLTPVRRYVHAQPTHTPINRIEYELLGALALSGWAMRAALTEAVNWHKGLDPRSGVFKQAWAHLQHADLWHCDLVRVAGRSVALVRLTDYGRERLTAVGLPACASEWDIILARHSGDAARQSEHTAAIVLFLHHARRFDYVAEACPMLPQAGRAQPDVRLLDDGEQIYVEVQGRGGEVWRRVQKWQNQVALQGHVALCACTPSAAERLAREAQRSGVRRGSATDLISLAQGQTLDLWTLRWSSPYMPLDRLCAP